MWDIDKVGNVGSYVGRSCWMVGDGACWEGSSQWRVSFAPFYSLNVSLPGQLRRFYWDVFVREGLDGF